VQADVIKITPRVTGPIVDLPIRDNQFVQSGEILFRIDPRTFEAESDRARAQLDETGDSVLALERARATYLVSVQEKRGAEAQLLQVRANLLESEASLAEAEAKLGAIGGANLQVRAAIAALRQAELNLEFTEVRAPVNGYVTNLTLRLGTQAVVNQPALALVDVATFRVDGFFRESATGRIRPGDEAVVTLMSYPDQPLEGYVDSLG
jgi:multidrug resistance efflux pump